MRRERSAFQMRMSPVRRLPRVRLAMHLFYNLNARVLLQGPSTSNPAPLPARPRSRKTVNDVPGQSVTYLPDCSSGPCTPVVGSCDRADRASRGLGFGSHGEPHFRAGLTEERDQRVNAKAFDLAAKEVTDPRL